MDRENVTNYLNGVCDRMLNVLRDKMKFSVCLIGNIAHDNADTMQRIEESVKLK